VTPAKNELRGSTVKLKWLAHQYGDIAQHNGNKVKEIHQGLDFKVYWWFSIS